MYFLFKRTDIASLAFFRVCFGILAFADVMGMLIYYHWMKDAYNPDKFHFTYYGFEWVHPFPEPFMSLFLVSMLLAAVFIAWGRYYRWSAAYYAFGFTYMFLVEKAHYLNHGYLFCMLSFVMVLLPAHRAYSWDSIKNPSIRSVDIPFYPIFLLRFMMGLVYFMGGIAKLNQDWLHAVPLKMWLRYKKDYVLIGPLLEQEWVAWFMSYGGLLLDLFIAPLLLWRKTRVFGFFALLFFHITNTMVFQIGIFPWLSICLSALYFSTSFPRHLWAFFKKRFPKTMLKMETWWGQREAGLPQGVSFYKTRIPAKGFVQVALPAFCIIHLLLPFRHHYFEGDVAWTEEGHRYAWRMMLRSKQGRGHFKVKNLEADTLVKVFPNKELPPKQGRKLYTHPDMILQYAHYLYDEYRTIWGTDSVGVYAHIYCRLNGGKYQRYIDPDVDLSKEEWSFLKESKWIVPLQDKNRRQYD